MLGITGGLASGKSTVANLLADRGARVVDADRIVHRLLESEPVKTAVRRSFGPGVFDAGGRVSRAQLAEAAFGRPAEVAKLNSILHPPALEEIRAQARRYRQEAGVPLVVIDAPLLTETGLDRELCDVVLFVEAPRPLRLRRSVQERGLDAEQFARREQAQAPEDAKKRQADYVVTNDGRVENLARQVAELWPELCTAQGRRK